MSSSVTDLLCGPRTLSSLLWVSVHLLLNMDNHILPSWLGGLPRSEEIMDVKGLWKIQSHLLMRGMTGPSLQSDLWTCREFLEKCGPCHGEHRVPESKAGAGAVQTCGQRNIKSWKLGGRERPGAFTPCPLGSPL